MSYIPYTQSTVLATVTNFDLKTTGQTTILTIPAYPTAAVITEVTIMITSADAATIGATVGVGAVGDSYLGWCPASALTTMISVGDTVFLSEFAAGTIRKSYIANDVLKIDIRSGATATSLRATILVEGYYL